MPLVIRCAWRTRALLVACLLIAAPGAQAEDWPEFRGKGRLGVWRETGILERFPDDGLNVAWRTPINRGYSGPAVADGRVFVSDFARTSGLAGIERAVCLDERTGEILWTHEWEANYAGISWDEGPRATPTVDGDRVYVQGAAGTLVALDVETGEPLWSRHYREEYGADMPILTQGLHSVLATPVIIDGYIYGVGSYGQLRCLDAASGERIWETQAVTVERARWASAFIVRHEDRFFINNDRGDLIIARLTPAGYEEISRTHLIAPTSEPGNRRELETVNWSHPAYANRRIYARNDEEIIAASLAAP